MDIICGTHVQCMYMYIHCKNMHMQCTCIVHTKTVQAHTGFNQLYELVPTGSWLVTQPLPFLTSTASTRGLASLLAPVTLQQRMAGVRCCSNVYEVNQWLWQFGRGKPRLGGLSVEKTDDRKEAALKEWSLRWAETRQRRKADRAWWEVKCGSEAV